MFLFVYHGEFLVHCVLCSVLMVQCGACTSFWQGVPGYWEKCGTQVGRLRGVQGVGKMLKLAMWEELGDGERCAFTPRL